MRAQITKLVGVVTEGKGGEDKHERGIEMTKNEVEIHLILFYSFYYVE